MSDTSSTFLTDLDRHKLIRTGINVGSTENNPLQSNLYCKNTADKMRLSQ